MRLAAAIAVLALAVAPGCGSGSPSPESVVRAWSQALNTGDNEGAAELFAQDAQVIQPSGARILHTRSDALAFNQSLPCSGTIVAVSASGDTVTATFLLGDRPTSPCDGPGQKVHAEFVVRNGKIDRWEQLSSAQAPASLTI